MSRPYIICHMLTSLNGKISGPFISDAASASACEHYERIDREFMTQGFINGRVTVDENFTFYKKPDLRGIEGVRNFEDFIAPHEESGVYVAFDLRGTLGWERNFLKYADRPRMHIVEVVSRHADPKYLGYLRAQGISYLVVGENKQCTEAMEKLHELLEIKRIMLEGGGVLNEAFASEDLIDEISLVMSPVYDTVLDTHSAFEALSSNEQQCHHFALMDAKILGAGNVWIRYQRLQNSGPV